MTARDGAGPHRTPPPGEAIQAAQQALERLREADGHATGRPPAAFAVVGWVVAALALAGLVLHTFFQDGLQVTETSVLLLALALLAPFASRLKVIEFGGAKAEWRDTAAAGLSNVLDVLETQHTAIEALVASLDELTEQRAEAEQIPPGASALRYAAARVTPSAQEHVVTVRRQARRLRRGPEPTPAGQGGPEAVMRSEETPPAPAPQLRPVRRVLWVDDNPGNNAYEIDGLRRLLDVDEATSTTEALQLLGTGRYGLVISDVVREEAGKTNFFAGQELLRAMHGMGIAVPVIFYAGDDSLRIQAASLREHGAADVVSTHVDLLTAVRRATREVFEAAVNDCARALLVEPQSTAAPVDFLLEVPGTGAVALELANWLRRPKPVAFTERASRLAALVADGTVEAGWIVTPGPVLTAELAALAPPHIEILTFDQLRERLAEA